MNYVLEILHEQLFKYRFPLTRCLEVGRQSYAGEALGVMTRLDPKKDRLVIEPVTEVRIARRQLLLTPLDDGVLVENPSRNALVLSSGETIEPQEKRALKVPQVVSFGSNRAWQAALLSTFDESSALQTLSHRAPVPRLGSETETALNSGTLKLSAADAEALGTWLKAIAEVLHCATSNTDFYDLAVRRVVTLLSFSSARMLLFSEGEWVQRAECMSPTAGERAGEAFSLRLLEQARSEQRTIWKDATNEPLDKSQIGLDAVVCAPIRNGSGQVIGALYADRYAQAGSTQAFAITPTEALLVETLAFGIAAGLERMQQEKVAAEEQHRFSLFFGPELTHELAEHPELLTGKDALVTVLFCDLRNFSTISEKVGTAVTMEWIHDAFGALSECVKNNDGVIVDYIGDELMAMWGAPREQPRQAELAARAALEMLACLEAVNARWNAKLGHATQVGIGIHTGTAQVGNVGSSVKYKYGPLGHTVNLASRVQGVNKFLRTELLLTAETHGRLQPGRISRQVCSVRVQNIDEPIKLFELLPDEDERGRILCQLYEQALKEFEQGDYRRAVRTLGAFLPQYEDDGPAHILLARAVEGLVKPEKFDPVWELPGK